MGWLSYDHTRSVAETPRSPLLGIGGPRPSQPLFPWYVLVWQLPKQVCTAPPRKSWRRGARAQVLIGEAGVRAFPRICSREIAYSEAKRANQY